MPDSATQKKWLLALVALCVLIGAATDIGSTYLMRPIINNLIGPGTWNDKIAALIGALALLAGIDIVIANLIEVTVEDTICNGHDYNGAKFKPLNTANLAVGVHSFKDSLHTVEGGCDSVVSGFVTM